MRQIAATRRRDRLLQQIASCDMWKSLSLRQNLSLRSVARIQTGLNLCDISQRQNKGKGLVAATVQTRRLVVATCRCDLSHRVSRPLISRARAPLPLLLFSPRPLSPPSCCSDLFWSNWWEASALATTPSLFPLLCSFFNARKLWPSFRSSLLVSRLVRLSLVDASDNSSTV